MPDNSKICSFVLGIFIFLGELATLNRTHNLSFLHNR